MIKVPRGTWMVHPWTSPQQNRLSLKLSFEVIINITLLLRLKRQISLPVVKAIMTNIKLKPKDSTQVIYLHNIELWLKFWALYLNLWFKVHLFNWVYININPFYPEPSAPDLLLLLDWLGGSFIASSSHWLLTNVFFIWVGCLPER